MTIFTIESRHALIVHILISTAQNAKYSKGPIINGLTTMTQRSWTVNKITTPYIVLYIQVLK